MSQRGPSTREIIQLVSSSLSQVASFEKSEQLNDSFCNSDDVPAFTSVLAWLDVKQGIKLEKEQRMAYDVICSSFLLKILDDNEINDDDESNNVIISHVNATLNKELKCLARDAVNCLRAYGGDKQLIMFWTEPEGAEKSTADKAEEQFCMLFCRQAHIPWMGSTYLYTAYTGSAAALFNGVTICKKAGIKIKRNRPLPPELIDGWNNV